MEKNKELQEEIKCFKSMLDSCFAYGGVEKDGMYYDRYILPYKKDLGSRVFNKVYKEYKKYLEENYTIKEDVHTDSEDVSYNSLVKINQ